jgi:hypothetical protein
LLKLTWIKLNNSHIWLRHFIVESYSHPSLRQIQREFHRNFCLIRTILRKIFAFKNYWNLIGAKVNNETIIFATHSRIYILISSWLIIIIIIIFLIFLFFFWIAIFWTIFIWIRFIWIRFCKCHIVRLIWKKIYRKFLESGMLLKIVGTWVGYRPVLNLI